MVWVIVAAAIVVLGLAAWAGTGKFGEMPPVVDDRPKGRIPEGPVDDAFLAEVRLPVASQGYDRGQVMGYLRSVADGDPAGEPSFDIRAGGYDMQVVDEILDRPVPAPEMLVDDYFVDGADYFADGAEDDVDAPVPARAAVEEGVAEEAAVPGPTSGDGAAADIETEDEAIAEGDAGDATPARAAVADRDAE